MRSSRLPARSATVASVYVLQTSVDSSFWESVKQSEDGVQHVAGALMFLAELGDLLLYTALGCVVGLLLALRSIRLRQKMTTLGYVSLSFNGAPLMIGVLLWIMALKKGW